MGIKSVQKLLVITPFPSRWVDELDRQLNSSFEVEFLALGIPPAPRNGDEVFTVAQRCSQLMNQAISAVRPDGVYISCEFAWDIFQHQEFIIPFDPKHVVFMLWDDLLFHQNNLQSLATHQVTRVVIGDKIGELVYKRQGFEAIFCPLEGSRQVYFSDPNVSPVYGLSFFGATSKADREQYLGQFAKEITLRVFGNDPLSGAVPVSYAQLAHEIRLSSLVLNFSKVSTHHRSGVMYQLKGRIFEALFCGVLPVTEYCPNTDLLFEDLVPQFRESAEGIDIAKTLLADFSKKNIRLREAISVAEKFRPEKIYQHMVF